MTDQSITWLLPDIGTDIWTVFTDIQMPAAADGVRLAWILRNAGRLSLSS
jgi:hypothetical protein